MTTEAAASIIDRKLLSVRDLRLLARAEIGMVENEIVHPDPVDAAIRNLGIIEKLRTAEAISMYLEKTDQPVLILGHGLVSREA